MILGANPLADFGYDCESRLLPIRANVIACHEMMNHSDLTETDVQDALGHLIVDAYSRLDKLIEAHGAALEAVREARTA